MGDYVLSAVVTSDAKNAEEKPREPLWRHLLGSRLRGLRHERGETLDDVASRAGVSPQYLSEIERGLKEPSSEMIAAVSGALETALVDLTLDIAESLLAAQRTVDSHAAAHQSDFRLAA